MNSRLQPCSLKWDNYRTQFSELCCQLLETDSMVDVTLCAEGQHIKVHRIVLATCSSYFQEILLRAEEQHPLIILSDTNFEDIKYIVEFVYRGEINLTKERFASVLKTAEELRINGLSEVASYWPDLNSAEENEITLEVWDAYEESDESSFQNLEAHINESGDICIESAHIETEELSDVIILERDGIPEKRRKRKKDSLKKEYREAALAAALEELKAGKTLLEVSSAHHIPRSTLYVRARSQNIPIVASRQDHSKKIHAAVQAVSDGASLQEASKIYKIPKTVLWRRVHKEVNNYPGCRRGRPREAYGCEKKQAAIMALERGEDLSKVSHQYQIPKTTLFRERTRLVESGKLVWSSSKGRRSESDGYKEHRLNEAVAACREGKMSQASASQKFQVPKTTIWRRLKDVKSHSTLVDDSSKPKDFTEISSETDCDSSVLQVQPDCTFQEVPSHLPVPYLDESDFNDSSLLMLATNEGAGMTLQEENDLIVSSEASSSCPQDSAAMGACEDERA